jgi:hypothetical protein
MRASATLDPHKLVPFLVEAERRPARGCQAPTTPRGICYSRSLSFAEEETLGAGLALSALRSNIEGSDPWVKKRQPLDFGVRFLGY